MTRPSKAFVALSTLAGLAVLSGCMVPLRQKPSVAVDLSGHWVLDRLQSATVESALRSRMEAMNMPADGGARAGGGMRGGGGGRMGGGGGGMRGGGGMPGADGNPDGGNSADRGRGAAALGKVNLSSFDNLVEWPGTTLVVTQTSGSMRFEINGIGSRFSSGARGCDVENYVPESNATLKCGWEKDMWVLETHPKQHGQKVMRLFFLEGDNKKLVQVINLTGGPLGSVNIRRVYNAVPQ